MAVPTQLANINPRKLVTPSSRYVNSRVIYWSEAKLITFETYIRKPYVASGNEKVMSITKGVEYRPDLVSFEVYGFPDLWWKIMEANGIADIIDFKAGRTILLPNLTS